jgi:integrase
VQQLAERYIEEWLPRKSPESQRGDRGMIAKDILPAIGRLKVAAVRDADIYNLHAKITKRAPHRANHVLAVLSKMFSLAIKPWGYRTDNPVKGIARNPESRRERFLSPAEIGRLSEALNASPWTSAVECIKFLLLTGARSGETLAARWDQFDFEAGVWTKPSAHTKTRKTHRVPLSGPARQLLQKIRPEGASDTDFVFPGRKPGESVKQLRLCWYAACKAAGITNARIHDLRHTFASVLASSGSSLPIIGQLLGHTQPGTTQRYAHLLDDPLREATERVGAIVTGAKKAKVVSLKRT